MPSLMTNAGWKWKFGSFELNPGVSVARESLFSVKVKARAFFILNT